MITSLLITPWDYQQSWENGSCSYDGHTITWKNQTIIVTNYIKQKYLSPDWYLKKLTEHWELIGFIALFLSDGTTASTQELSQALKLNLSVVNNAVELGFSIGWFEVNEKVSLIFLEEKCDNSIYVQESEQVLELPDSAQVGNLWESARTITTVQTSSVNDSPVSPTTETCEGYQLENQDKLTCLQLHHHVNHFPSTVNDSEQPTNETVSPQCLKVLPESSQNSSASRMLPDSLLVPTTQDNQQGHILGAWSQPLTAAGMMLNGFVYVQDTLQPPFLDNDYFWLESPGALSSTGNGRPPGQTKLETQLKKLRLLHKGEVLNPVILSEWYDIPPSWLDPWESRPATALLENKDRQQEIFLIPELPPSELTEFNTLPQLPGSITTEKFLEENLDTEELNQETSLTEKFLEESSSTDKSNACGCLYQYIENKKLKNGTIVSYPRVEGERDKHNYLHWRWGYSWEEKIDGQWKNRSLGVSTKIVTQVANMIYNGNSVQNIREFIALSKNYRKSDK
nr:DNA methylase [Aphanizomenon flos-aquae]